jgi:flagellar motor switch/type III secretory pathway protein FliN
MSVSETMVDEISRFDRIGLTVEAELDRTVMAFDDVATLGPGSLIRLGSSAGETISIQIGDVRIGSAEVLVVDGVLTIRVAELADPSTVSEVLGH